MLSILLKSPKEVQTEIKERFKALRLDVGYTQEALSKRSGVSLGSLKRFEQIGEISLSNLLRLAVILEALNDFEELFKALKPKPKSIDEILKDKSKQRKRGYKK